MAGAAWSSFLVASSSACVVATWLLLLACMMVPAGRAAVTLRCVTRCDCSYYASYWRSVATDAFARMRLRLSLPVVLISILPIGYTQHLAFVIDYYSQHFAVGIL